MKGIILAGGAGTRLDPITRVASKQLLPVFDKPMIYYPLSVLMLAGIRDILVITTPADKPLFERLLGTGEELGITISFAEQPEPNGLAEAFIIGREHIADDSVCLILGDNIFYGSGLARLLQTEVTALEGCTLFGYPVKDGRRYGVPETDDQGRLIEIVEKPKVPKVNVAVTGIYFYDNTVVEIAARQQPSDRDELEITDLNNVYIQQRRAKLVDLGRGTAWLDTGTHESLLEAGQFVQVIENRQGVRIACLEEVALRMGYISADQTYLLGEQFGPSGYGEYIKTVAIAAKDGRFQQPGGRQ